MGECGRSVPLLRLPTYTHLTGQLRHQGSAPAAKMCFTSVMTWTRWTATLACSPFLFLACGPESVDPQPSGGNGNGDGDNAGPEIVIGDGDGDGDIGDRPPAKEYASFAALAADYSGAVQNTPDNAAPQDWECGTLPNGQCFSPAGAYSFAGAVADTALETSAACTNVLRGIVRDFDHSHPDFGGDSNGDGIDAGLVQSALGEDRKPISTGAVPSVASALDEWFQNDAGGNVPYVVDFWLEPQGEFFVFDSSRFFPVDGVGTTSGADNNGQQRNFGFTTELHTAFEYQGGEVFTFTGDDDVFIFINNVLAVDLGGVHSQFSGTVNIDTFAAAHGMEIGGIYNLDLFHAERNPTGSNFRIETSLDFKDCGVLAQDIIVR